MSVPPLAQEELDRLCRHVTGAVVAPGEPAYDDARAVWNAMIDRHPAAVVRAAGVGDVVATIDEAREDGHDLAVRGGGHNVAGHGTVDGGIVLDLGDLDEVSVDLDTSTVRVEGGATLADVDAATEPHGLAVPLGVVSGTGVAGLTLGGGVGWLTRKHGLTADNLLSVELVTAAGRSWSRPRSSTQTSSGPCEEVVATSAWSPPSPSVPIRTGRRCSAATCSTSRTDGPRRGRRSIGGRRTCPTR